MNHVHSHEWSLKVPVDDPIAGNETTQGCRTCPIERLVRHDGEGNEIDVLLFRRSPRKLEGS